MIDFRQALRKARRLDLSIWRRLVLLSLGAFLLGMATTFMDVGTVGLFLQKNTCLRWTKARPARGRSCLTKR